MRNLKLLEPNVITVYASPNKVRDQVESLGQQLRADHAQVAQEGSLASLACRVNIDARETVGHFALVFVECNELHVVPIVARLHQLKELLRFVA